MSSTLRLCSALVVCLTISGCGFGPLHTCRTPCKPPKERDAFCGCYTPSPPSTGTNPNNPAPPNYGSPYLNFTWANSSSCGSLNRAYYVFNPTPNDLELWVSRKQRSGSRVGSWVSAAKSTVTFQNATYIGLEGLEPDCFDQDFQAGSWRDAKTKQDGYLAHLAATNGIPIEKLQA